MKKTISLILSILLILSSVAVAGTAFARDESYVPSIVIPGIFQSEVKLYNKDGTLVTNEKGEEFEAPFFLDSTADIVKDALFNAIYPISRLLLSQKDKDDLCAKTVADVGGRIVFGKTLGVDENGEFLYDVKATKYAKAAAYCSEYDQNYIYDQIPLQQYSEIAGGDNLFFFSYYSFGSIEQTVEELYDFIFSVMEQTGSDKVNIVPISQGGTLANALLAYNGGEIMKHLNRIVYIVPALDGANIVGELFTNGLVDSDDMLYSEMFPKLFDEDQQWLAYLVNIILRIMPNADVNNIIDKVVEELVGKYLKRASLMWALCPSTYYPAAAQKYLSDPEDAAYKAETEWYYREAQLKSDENILKAINEYGVEVFDIVDYNSEVYAIVDGYNKENGDGIIQLSSTAMGTTSFGVNVQLPADYQTDPEKAVCTDPTHNHIDPWNLIDASTALLPEHTFFFKDQNHERTAQNDVIIKLATRLLTDSSFKDIYSYPDEYPQFNTGRLARSANNAVRDSAKIDRSKLSAEDAAKLDATVAEIEAILADTYVTAESNEKLDTAIAEVYALAAKASGAKEDVIGNALEKVKTFLLDLLTKVISFISNFLFDKFGGKGFSEIIGLR